MSDYNSNQHLKYDSVGGWLMLFCFGLTIGSPIKALYDLTTSYNEVQQYFDLFSGLKNIFYIDTILSIILMFLSIRAGAALWSIKSGAVKTAKNYLLIYLGYSFIALPLPFMTGLPSEANEIMIPETIIGAIRSLLYFVIWYSYLNVSKRVKATYQTTNIE